MEVGLLIVRLAVGVVIAYHGTEKLFAWWGGEGLDGAAEFFGRVGYRPPRVMAAVAGTTETAGGVLLLLGAATPLATCMLIGTFVNILQLHLRNGLSRRRNGFEYELVLLAGASCLALTGPGPLSVDALLGIEAIGARWGWAALATGVLSGLAVSATRLPGVPVPVPGLRRLRTVGRGIAGACVLAAAYEGFARLGLVDRELLPPSSAVLPEAASLLVDPDFLREVWATLAALLTGVGIAVAIAVPVGLLLGSYRLMAKALMPIVDSLRSVPGIAIIPLLVLVVGQGLQMKVTIVVFVAVWPLLFNTMYGVRGVDRVAIETARSFRIPTAATWWHVVLPSALPLIVTGLRLALSTGLTVAIAAEIAVGTQDGIGHVVLRASHAGFRFEEVFAAVTLAGVLGYLLNGLTGAASARLTAWSTREVS